MILLYMSKAYVYIMSNIPRSVFYTGVTSNLVRRIWEHKEGKGSKFTSKYKLTILLYAEEHQSISEAITREKLVKRWKREWKLDLIKSINPELVDLYPTLRE
ncbi:MAG: GIY-YIG nuclease family protein [Balneola sp.]